MIRIAIGMLLGSVMVLHFAELPILVMCISILLIAVSFLIYFKIHKIKYLEFISAIVVGFSMTATVAGYQQSQSLDPALEGKDLLIRGSVDSLVKVNDINRSFIFKVAAASLVKSAEPTDFTGRIRLSVYDKSLSINAGEEWQFQVRLKRSSGFKNPNSFDYEKWLFAQGIHAKGYLRKSTQHELLKDPPWYSVNSLRETIHQKIKEALGSTRNFALVSALILAEKTDLTKQDWEVFRTTGTSHLMAISGLHIGLVASSGLLLVWLIWWCFPRLNLVIPQRLAGGMLGVLLAVFYALLAGMTIPTQRALILVVIGLVLLLGRQYFSAYRILALTMVLVLITDPLAIMNAGFYLSFSAVLVILWLLRRVVKSERFSLIKLQCFLSFLMIPLSLFFFGEGSLISPIANLIAIPWVSFVVVPLSMLSVLASFISESLAS
jgi:competence protein ComEC